MSVRDTPRLEQPMPAPTSSSAWWWAMLIGSLAIAAYGTRYFVLPTSDPHFSKYLLPLRLHIAGGMGALLAGPFQFSEKLRQHNLNLHRWTGRFYLLSVALGSIAGFVMAAVSMEGMPTHFGFGALAVLWFFTAAQAYRVILRGDIDRHREWMIRNFALSLAAVTLRLELPFMLAALHWSFHVSYTIVSWLCWAPNLLLAEWMITRSRQPAVP